jgi:ketol-acid reductoisomerase
MARMYFDEDADLSCLENRVVGYVGFGNQGRSQALNMRDSGVKVIVGTPPDASADQAREDGFQVHTVAEVVQKSDVVMMLVPDEIMPVLYNQHIEPHLRNGMVLSFASGYNVTHKFITPPKGVDVVMVAPRMIGKGVRDTFVRGDGFPSLIAVEQDASGLALQRTLAIAKGIGSTRVGVVMSSFAEETTIDLFSEHLGEIYSLRLSYEVLTEAGCSPEAVLLEIYASGESSEIYAAARDLGLWGQVPLHSRTSQYGQQITSQLFADAEARRDQLRKIVRHIRSGEFAREWQEEQMRGMPELIAKTNENLRHPMQQAENRLYRLLKRRDYDLTSASWLQGPKVEE